MTMQLLLLQEPPHGAARKSDPATSKKAARKFNPTSLNGQILDLLGRISIHNEGLPSGLTIAELAQLSGRKEVSISPRMKGLVEERRIKDSGERRKNAGSRCEAIVWVLA